MSYDEVLSSLYMITIGMTVDECQARDGFFSDHFYCRYLSHFTLIEDFCLGSLAHGKHLVPLVFALQCLTGKADKKK